MSSRLFAFAAAALLAASGLNAQVSGRVTGTVVDASGAAVPNADVSLQLPGGNSAIYSTKTGGTGDFSLPAVNPATYNLVVETKGFVKVVVGDLQVDSDRSTDVPTVKLQVASVTATVEVSGATQTVETSNAEIATTITNQQVQNLPTLNRDPLGFLMTQAGINFQARGGDTTIDGQRPSYTNVTLDGINIQDNFIRTNDLSFLPNLLLLDQISEVTVSTSNANSAAFGGSSQVSFVTPSGTNSFHGKAYWSNRNNYFAANTWFNNQAGVKIPFLNQNQVGGVIGGPIKKNKLFFYANYEAYRQRQQTAANTTLLTADARNGVFTYLNSGGAVQRVNLLQAAGVQIDPAMAKILGTVPAADKINNFLRGDSSGSLLRNTAGYSFLQRDNRTRDNVSIKGDYAVSPKNTVNVSYIYNRDLLDRPDADTTFDIVPTVSNNDHIKLLSSAWRSSPTANITNEARFGFNLAPATFPATQTLPPFFVTGESFTNPENTFLSQGRYTHTYNWGDNANWVHGSHSFYFGFQGEAVRIQQYNAAGIVPSYGVGIGANPALTAAQLPGISASDLSAANTLLSSLAGYVTSYTQTFNVNSRTSGFVNGAQNARNDILNDYAAFGQDTWKLSRRWTATLGLRWEYYSPVDERDALALFPVLQNNNVFQTVLNPNATLDFAGSAIGRSWYKSDKNNFAPNIGLAWDVFGDGKTAFRAGYGISYVNDDVIRAVDNSQATNAGLSATSAKTNLSGLISSSLPAIPAPAYKVPRTLADNYALSSSSAVGIPDPGLVTPYVQQWNVGIQHAFKSWIAEVRYVGNHGTKEIRAIDYNQVIINGILPDFQKAQSNGLLAQKATGVFNPAFNASIPGSQPLPFFAQLPNGGNLANGTILSDIQTGQVGDLASFYQSSRINGPANFFPNPNVLGANVLENFSNSTYNALQVDVNHRFGHGFSFQTNYVFSRALSDAEGNQQTDFEPLLDINNAKLERSRPTDFSLTHVFKANGVYELPFGPNRQFHSGNRVLSKVMEGWNVAGIYTKQSGNPFSVFSGRGTLNRGNPTMQTRSANNTVDTTLTQPQLNDLFQFRMTGNGPYMVAASAIGPDGRGVAPDGSAPFAGQVFFEPAAGTLGTLQRAVFTGPSIWDFDAKISKVTHIKERQTLELRMDATNVFNHPDFFISDQTLTSTTFGKITSNPTLGSARRLVQFALYYSF